jgi:hypothetical protein
MHEFFDKVLKLNRLTVLNIILGLLIAITPVKYIAFANTTMGGPNELSNGDTSSVFIFVVGLIFLLVWIGDFWASKYRANLIYLKRTEQEKKGVSLIGGYGYIHVFTSLTMAGAIGMLLGSFFGIEAILIPILVILALVKEPFLLFQIKKIRENPRKILDRKKEIISDVILLLYAYLIFIVSWQSFVYSGNFEIDFSKSSAVFMLFFTTIIYLLFYLGACWIWFEEVTVNLVTRKQKLYFIGAFTFEVIMVIVKLIK